MTIDKIVQGATISAVQNLYYIMTHTEDKKLRDSCSSILFLLCESINTSGKKPENHSIVRLTIELEDYLVLTETCNLGRQVDRKEMFNLLDSILYNKGSIPGMVPQMKKLLMGDRLHFSSEATPRQECDVKHE